MSRFGSLGGHDGNVGMMFASAFQDGMIIRAGALVIF